MAGSVKVESITFPLKSLRGCVVATFSKFVLIVSLSTDNTHNYRDQICFKLSEMHFL